ncbi:MAG: undecaprenyl-diphosphate phosphatase [Thermoleophilia bacterium]|nr:undecaprenyl-diphosphate phosphatase [Thermoleophilia bacterium]
MGKHVDEREDAPRARARAVVALALAALAAAVVLAGLGVGEEPGALSNWQALVLGLVQGLTELLPISSSGHLVLVPWLADWRYLREHDEFNHTFDVALHLGTLVAVVGYFRRELAVLLAAWARSARARSIRDPDERLAWAVVVATVPAVVIGAAAQGVIASRLGEPWQIAILLAVFGVVLWLADRRPATRDLRSVGIPAALAVGVAQALALAPGVSRSGVTISAGRLLGLDRDGAARLSFLLLVPVTLGAVALKGITDVLLADLPPGTVGPFVVGTLAAAVSGLAAISALLGYVRRRDYSPFVVYRLLVAAVVLGVIASGVREPGF